MLVGGSIPPRGTVLVCLDSAGVAVGGVVEGDWLFVAGGLSAGLEGAGSCEVVDDGLDWVGGCVL